MRYLLFIICMLITSILASPNKADRQVLIFRNSGDVTILYTDKLQSITVATDNGTENRGIVQMFELSDTTITIPIAEIDSVTFGCRNRISLNKDVLILTEQHINHIESYDGTKLLFDSQTPYSILPAIGQKIYCDIFSEIIPDGIAARVESIYTSENTTTIRLENVELDEIFDDLFFAGEIDPESIQVDYNSDTTPKMMYANTDDGIVNIISDFFKISGKCDISFRDVVVDIKRHFYKATAVVKPSLGFEIKLKTNNEHLKKETTTSRRSIPLGAIAAVIRPRIEFAGFCDIEASAQLDLTMERQWEWIFNWNHINGKNTLTPISPEEVHPTNKANIEILLDGEIHAGLLSDLKIGLIGDIAGIGAETKIGPSLKASLSVGTITQLEKEYQTESYAKGVVSLESKAAGNIYAFYRDWQHKDIVTNLINEFILTIGHVDWPLFPEFNTKARPARAKLAHSSHPELAISSSAKTDTPIASTLMSGFVLVDTYTGTVADSALVTPISADIHSGQGYSTYLRPTPGNTDMTRFRLYPIFRYAGHTVKGKPSGIRTGGNITNYFFNQSKNRTRITGGAYIVSKKIIDNTDYIQGNTVRIPTPDPIFLMPPSFASTALSGTESEKLIFGNWVATLYGHELHIEFLNGGTGSLNDSAFRFNLDNPSAGNIEMTYSDGTADTVSVISISHSELSLYFKSLKRIISFKKS